MGNKLTIDIDGNVGALKSKLEKVGGMAKSAFGGIGKIGSGAVKAVSASIGAVSASIGVLSASIIQAYGDYEQLTGGVETLFKDSAGMVMDYAKNAYKTAGLSANEYMAAVTSFSASLLQSLGGDTDAAAKVADTALTDMADNANKMGTSMESIQNAYQGFAKQNYTMLDNLKLGYGGTKTEMQRLLKDAQKISGVKYDIKNLADVYNAIHVIQGGVDELNGGLGDVEKGLGITGTTALEAGTTIQGSAASMKAAWENMLVGIASGTDDFDGLMNNLVESVAAFAGNLLPVVLKAMSGAGELIARLAPMIAEQIPVLMTTLVPQLMSAGLGLLNALTDGFVSNAPALASAGSEILRQLSDGILSISGNLMPLVETLVGTIAEGFILYQNLIFTVGIDLLAALVQGLADAMPTLVPMAQKIITGLVNHLTAAAPGMLDAALDILLALANGLAALLPTLVPQAAALLTGLAGMIASNAGEMVSAAVSIITALVEGLTGSIPILVESIPQIITALITGLTGEVNLAALMNAAVTLFTALVNAVPSILTALVEALPQIITAILGFMLDPAQTEAVIGGFVTMMLAMTSAIPEIVEALAVGLATLVRSVADYFSEHGDEIVASFKAIGTDIAAAVSTWWTDMKANVEAIWTNIKQVFKDLWDDLVGHSIVWDIINDVIAAFAGWWGSLKDIIGNLVDNIVGKFKEAKDAVAGFFKGLFGKKEEANVAVSADMTGTGGLEAGGLMAIDPLQPVPQAVIDSYVLLNEAVTALNAEIGKLNSFFGGAAGAVSGDAASGGGGGGVASLMSGMTAVAEYLRGTLTDTLDTFGAFMTDTFLPKANAVRDALYIPGGGGNTLCNSLGEVKGLVEDIRAVFLTMIAVWKHDFPDAADGVKKKSGELCAVLTRIERRGRAIETAFIAAAKAIQDVVSLLANVPVMPGGKKQQFTVTEKGTDASRRATAWSGWTSTHGLTLVGERGPELIGTSRMMNVWRNDEIAKRLASARDTVRAMSLPRVNVSDMRRVDQSTTNNHTNNMNFGNVYGEKYLTQMVEAAAERVIRKGVFLGAP